MKLSSYIFHVDFTLKCSIKLTFCNGSGLIRDSAAERTPDTSLENQAVIHKKVSPKKTNGIRQGEAKIPKTRKPGEMKTRRNKHQEECCKVMNTGGESGRVPGKTRESITG